MADTLIGSWSYESGENSDEFMAAVGVPEQMREMAKAAKPSLEITKEGNVWTIKTTVGDKISETKYPENEEIDTVSLIGQPIKATMTVKSDGVEEVQKAGDFDVIIKRKVDDGVLVSTLNAKGVEAILKFTKAA